MNKTGSRESKSPWGQFTETVKEKLDTVRGRRYSKEQGERDQRPDSSEVSSRRSENVVFVLVWENIKVLAGRRVATTLTLGAGSALDLERTEQGRRLCSTRTRRRRSQSWTPCSPATT